MRGDQHLVARPDAGGDQGGHQSVAAAGGKGEVADAEIGSVALLETVAFTANSIAEQRALADDVRQRLDLFFTDDVHVPFRWLMALPPVRGIRNPIERVTSALLDGANPAWVLTTPEQRCVRGPEQ